MVVVPTSTGSTEVKKIGLKYEQLLSQMCGLRGKAASAESQAISGTLDRIQLLLNFVVFTVYYSKITDNLGSS